VADALNANDSLEPLLTGLLGTLDGGSSAIATNPYIYPLLNDMMTDNPRMAEVLASSIQKSVTGSTSGLLNYLGLNMRLQFWLFGIPLDIDASARFVGAWPHTWPEPPANWPTPAP
jgi:hypothetical protein